MAPHSSTLAWKIPWAEKPGRLQSMESLSQTRLSDWTELKWTELNWTDEDIQDLLELTLKKRCPFHYRGLECKSRKSRNTWSNRQIWPRSTEWSRAKANRVLPRESTGHSKHPLPTTQEKALHITREDSLCSKKTVDITRWSIQKSDWLYSVQPKMEKLYTVNKRV